MKQCLLLHMPNNGLSLKMTGQREKLRRKMCKPYTWFHGFCKTTVVKIWRTNISCSIFFKAQLLPQLVIKNATANPQRVTPCTHWCPSVSAMNTRVKEGKRSRRDRITINTREHRNAKDVCVSGWKKSFLSPSIISWN